MPFAVELTLDPESAAPIRALWRQIADAGARFMADSGADPHITLAIWDGMEVERAVAELTTLARETAPVAVTFTDVRAFGAEVVYLAPRPSARLTAIQRRVRERLEPLTNGGWAHYLPSCWTPHCTVAMEFSPVPVETVRTIAAGFPLPLNARAERMSIVEVRPARERFSHPLTGE